VAAGGDQHAADDLRLDAFGQGAESFPSRQGLRGQPGQDSARGARGAGPSAGTPRSTGGPRWTRRTRGGSEETRRRARARARVLVGFEMTHALECSAAYPPTHDRADEARGLEATETSERDAPIVRPDAGGAGERQDGPPILGDEIRRLREAGESDGRTPEDSEATRTWEGKHHGRTRSEGGKGGRRAAREYARRGVATSGSVSALRRADGMRRPSQFVHKPALQPRSHGV
jgi:hypothetical protein